MALGLQVASLSTDSAGLINVGALSFDMSGAAAAIALGIMRASAPQMSKLSTVVTSLVCSCCRTGKLMAFGLQVASLSTDSALLVDVGALRLDVVSGAAAVALSIGGAVAPQMSNFSTVVTRFAFNIHL